MNREPAIGERVRFPGNVAIGECFGRVTKVYKPRGRGGLRHLYLPITRWHAFVTVEKRPSLWPYQTDEFAPSVIDLESAP